MKITGKNAAVAQTAEDIITKGGLLTEPTEARIHAIVSNSTADDNGGTAQVETATAAGTIAGIAQVETGTIVGTIEAAGAGNSKIVATGGLIAGSPLSVIVPVANNDTASLVAGKVRTALLALPAITTHYNVSGTGANYILTAKVAAANDATLNLASDNDTCAGLTAAPESVDTTAGHPGTGEGKVTITSALYTGDVVVKFPVVVGDTPAQWAAKARAVLASQLVVNTIFAVGGTGAAIVLTALQGAANDATLNMALANDTCNGITAAGTSADTTAGIAGTGAKVIEINGVDDLYNDITERVELNGTGAVNTKKAYRFINGMKVISAGTGGKNAGLITATAATDSTISSQIEVGANIAQQAVYCSPGVKKLSNLYASVYNSTAGAQTSLEIVTKKAGGVWIPERSIVLNSETPKIFDSTGFLAPVIEKGTMFKFQATASAGSSAVVVDFELN